MDNIYMKDRKKMQRSPKQPETRLHICVLYMCEKCR